MQEGLINLIKSYLHVRTSLFLYEVQAPGIHV